MQVIWRDGVFECAKAAKTDSEVILYDENNNEINRIFNITDEEWNYISIQNGEWTKIPTALDIMRADVDFLLMLNEKNDM